MENVCPSIMGLVHPLCDLQKYDLITVQEALKILVRAGINELRDLALLEKTLDAYVQRDIALTNATDPSLTLSTLSRSASYATPRVCSSDEVPDMTAVMRTSPSRIPTASGFATGTAPQIEAEMQTFCGVPGNCAQILPDLVQVHRTITRIADQMQRCPEHFRDQLAKADQDNKKWMFYLMPVWNYRTEAPKAQQFWQLAQTVARDQNGDDWIAPHVTLHTRSSSLMGLAALFENFLNDISRPGWQTLLSTLHDPKSWVFDADSNPGAKKPSNTDQYVLHKAKIVFPEDLREWLTEHQDPHIFGPRKQDVAAYKKRRASGNVTACSKVPITEAFHISLYSFRAAYQPVPDVATPKTFCDEATPFSTAEKEGYPAEECDSGTLPKAPSMSDTPDSPKRLLRRHTTYDHLVPTEGLLQTDLVSAEWMLVFAAPGSTLVPPVVPEVLAAVRVSALAEGSLRVKPTSIAS